MEARSALRPDATIWDRLKPYQPMSTPPAEPVASKSPSSRFKRDEDGLIIGYPYKFTPEGRVDYLACVDRKHLFVIDSKKDIVSKAQGKPIDECDLSLVNEKWLRIKQGGFNQLLNLRGYTSIEYHSLQTSPEKAAVVCVLSLIGNYETEGYPIICSAIASATFHSMDKNFRPYMETFAENRAFARAVKRALQITVLSEDEIDSEALKGAQGEDAGDPASSTKTTSAEASEHLRQLCEKRNVPITFAAIKARAIKHNAELTPTTENERIKDDPATWTEWKSVQPIDCFLLIGKIKEADDAGVKGKKGGK